MRTLAILASAVLVTAIVVALTVGASGGGVGPPGSARPGDASPPLPTRTATPSDRPTSPPTPLPSGYTFYDDFDGAALSPAWAQDFNFPRIENTWSMAQASVRDGLLSITANRTPAGGWVSALLDTKSTWTQLYGTFEARMRIPVGPGLWPAFWSYRSGGGEAEIDTMEVCANPVGTNGGNDVGVLHTTTRWSGGQSGHDTTAPDLADGFHVYGVDWRPDRIVYSLDGREVARFTDPGRIPSAPMPLIVDLAVGGSWCGPSDATTPDGASLQVDWIRARP
jgi:beta-glucanase (GH16 family)